MKQNKTKFRFEQAGNNVHKLFIYDNVTAYGDFNWETWDYDESETSANFFREALEAIGDNGTIELHVNSYGGDVKEGIAIYSLLKQHKAQKICYVDGFAYSIASIICLACDKIIMGLGTSMLIHNMAMYTYGNAKQLRKNADDLDVLMASNRKIYMARAKNITEDQLAEMMDNETYLTPEQCLEYGFADEIGAAALDSAMLNQMAGIKIQQLQQQLNDVKSFKAQMKEFVQLEPPAGRLPADPANKNSDKAVKLMNAFINAFEMKGGNKK